MNDFEYPSEISPVEAAFPTRVDHLVPSYEELRGTPYRNGDNWGNRLFSDWFYFGLKSADGLIPRQGVDKQKALVHIKTVMRSWDPKHEHKEAGCAFLFDKWFDGDQSKWERADRAA